MRNFKHSYGWVVYPPTHNREPYDTRIVLSNIMFL
jgi:hypothetical protein